MEKKKRVRPTVTQVNELKSRINDLEAEDIALSSSNKLLEAELDRIREANASLKKRCAESESRLARLRGRSFMERLFNKQLED